MSEPSPGRSELAVKGMLCDPGDHFKGRFEIERKYRVNGFDRIRAEILSRGGVAFALGNRETDIFLDQPDGRLERNGQQQVLRGMQPSGRVLWICKGPGPERCVAMDLDDLDKSREMLSALGYVEIDRLVKSRDIYFIGDFHLTLDYIDDLGAFVEIAVMTDEENSLDDWAIRIGDLSSGLGLDQSMIEPDSYRVLKGMLTNSRAGTPQSPSSA
jgi:adenylate cyclase class 2